MTDRMLAPARRMLVVGALVAATGLMGAPCTSTCPDPAASNYDPPDMNQTGSVARSAVSAAASNNAPCEYACGRLGQLFAGGHGSAVVCYIDRGSEKHWPPPAGSSSPWTQTYTVPPCSVAIIQGHHSPVPTRVNAINASLVLRHIAMIEHRAPAQPSHGGFEDGGAVFVSSGNLTAEYSAFRRNSAGRSGGALIAKDGVFIVVRSCIFDGNRALSFGGAAIRVFHPQTVLIQRSAFTDNSAHSGGAILITGAATSFRSASIDGCTGSGNSGGTDGCAVLLQVPRSDTSACFSQERLALSVEGGDGDAWPFISAVPPGQPCVLPDNLRGGGACVNITSASTIPAGAKCDDVRRLCPGAGDADAEAGRRQRVGTAALQCNAETGVLVWESACVPASSRPPSAPRLDDTRVALEVLGAITLAAIFAGCVHCCCEWSERRRIRRASIAALEEEILSKTERLISAVKTPARE